MRFHNRLFPRGVSKSELYMVVYPLPHKRLLDGPDPLANRVLLGSSGGHCHHTDPRPIGMTLPSFEALS